jgi:thiol peroxidase
MITFKGNPLTLVGRQLKTGVTAPDFRVTAQDLKEVRLSDFKGKIKVLTSFPSIDTPVCDLQVKEFNKRASGVSRDVVIVGISKDLPFAQKRFCEAFDIKGVSLVSDYKTGSFGINYGLLIKELNLLARAVLILDANDTLRSIQIVPELTTPPDFQAALQQLALVVAQPAAAPQEAFPNHCTPCEGGIAPLPKDVIEKLKIQHAGWELLEDKKLVKTFKFRDFTEAKYFLDLVAVIAEEQGHHPAMTLTYTGVKITLTTHAAGGLTENDFIMARLIDELGF